MQHRAHQQIALVNGERVPLPGLWTYRGWRIERWRRRGWMVIPPGDLHPSDEHRTLGAAKRSIDRFLEEYPDLYRPDLAEDELK